MVSFQAQVFLNLMKPNLSILLLLEFISEKALPNSKFLLSWLCQVSGCLIKQLHKPLFSLWIRMRIQSLIFLKSYFGTVSVNSNLEAI